MSTSSLREIELVSQPVLHTRDQELTPKNPSGLRHPRACRRCGQRFLARGPERVCSHCRSDRHPPEHHSTAES